MICRSHCKYTTTGFSMYNVWHNRCRKNDTFLGGISSDRLCKQPLPSFTQTPSLTCLCALILMIVGSMSVVSADDPDLGSTTVREETPARSDSEPAASPGGKKKIDITDLDIAELELLVGPRALSRAFRNAARKATPATVTILSYGQVNVMANQNPPAAPATPLQGDSKPEERPEPDKNQLTGIGSGVIVSKDGMIITNNHVITGAKRVVVKLADETEVEATAVRGDVDSDVATLNIARKGGFPAVELGNSDLLEIGDWVLAIGSPFRLEATVSAGIISAKDRALRRISRGRLLQTDAAINPGNSGGPLVDLDGRAIAISTAIASRNGSYQGIGFAIPINQAKWIADELAEHNKVRRAAIGIRMAELNPKIAGKFKLPVGLGVLAYQITKDSAAEKAGIEPLDVILEFAGEKVSDPSSFQEIVERKPVGSIQDIKVYRKGKEIMLKVELATLEDPTLQKEQSTPKDSKNKKGQNGSEAKKSKASKAKADKNNSDKNKD
ncbi:MAG: S1C family serine protease [Rubripirellula sp.]